MTATKQARTPGPWNDEWYVDYTDGTVRNMHGHIVLFLPAAMAESPEVPARIVQCVNAHDELVAALRGLIEVDSNDQNAYCDAHIAARKALAAADNKGE